MTTVQARSTTRDERFDELYETVDRLRGILNDLEARMTAFEAGRATK